MVGKKLSIQFPNLAEGDTEIEHDDYEAQRQANIKANQELLLSLGLFSASVLFTPTKPLNSSFSSPTPKSKSKSHLVRSKSSFASINAGSGGRGDVKSSIALNRPKRITRSVSRTLDPSSPLTSTGRRMKRALSDDELYPIQRRSSRRDSYISSFSDDEDQDDKEHSTSRTKKFRRHTSSLFLSHQQRKHVSSHLLQRSADRLGVRIQNPKTFGSIPGIPVGTLWEKRMDCSTDAIHAPTVAGISGNADVGCWSICLSGGYEDDVDLGETFTYTGSGGRDLKGTKQNPKNLRTAPQSKDQTFDGVNGALKKSVETKRPIRV
nr:histone-lysine n-h3 lysine-9 specific suvh7-like [Melanopsichium pennsylvanicum 4]